MGEKRNLAFWEGSATSASNSPGIWGVDKLPEARVSKQSLDGGVEDVMALTQELSWVGLHVTATETCVSAARRRTTNVQMAATCEASIFRCSMNQMDLQAGD
ncbi:hypothetical protein WN944_014189 [Citrus x changshan-huyou]|uniref:Uncharacterized protein n=1 Tax=Citrus x changshan-huyou TaxID=2935761 RepID=A0AAP0M7F1_9ROSI